MKPGFVLLVACACFAEPVTERKAGWPDGPPTKLSRAAVASNSMPLVVLFRAGTETATAERILSASGIRRMERPDLVPGQYLIETDLAAALRLAQVEEVAHIYPASDDLVAGIPVHGCAGPSVETGEIAQLVSTVGHGWDGPARSEVAITYSLSQTGRQLSMEELAAVAERALGAWSEHARLRFRRVSGASARNINFVLATGAHGDPYTFDGRGRILAHTFYPADVTPEPLAGDIHIDDDEPWSTKVDPDLYSVILHEVGHSLGLGHSDRPGSVMYPYYRRLTGLQPDDVAALQRLYAAPLTTAAVSGPAPAATTPLPTTPTSEPTSSAAPAPGDTTAPALSFTFPAGSVYSTSATSIQLAGTARDASGIASVTWMSSTGTGGGATGAESWRTDPIPLLIGDNRITVYVRDAAGNTGRRAVLITRR
jgi:hypothetical protein